MEFLLIREFLLKLGIFIFFIFSFFKDTPKNMCNQKWVNKFEISLRTMTKPSKLNLELHFHCTIFGNHKISLPEREQPNQPNENSRTFERISKNFSHFSFYVFLFAISNHFILHPTRRNPFSLWSFAFVFGYLKLELIITVIIKGNRWSKHK